MKDVTWHLMLPVLTLAFVISGPLIRMTRQGLTDAARSEYVLYATAMGMPARRINRYILRNGIVPALTLTGVLFAFSLGGVALIETVFSLDGLGRYSVERMLSLDYPAVVGAVFVMTAFALVVYLVVDICHALIDPRLTVGQHNPN